MPSQNSYVVVDWDHTLTDPGRVLHESWASKSLGKVVRDAPLVKKPFFAFLYGVLKLAELYRLDGSPGSFPIRAAEALSRCIDRKNMYLSPEEFRPNAPVVGLLKELKGQGYGVVVLTSSPSFVVERWLEDAGIEVDAVKGLELLFKDGKVAGIDRRDRYSSIMAGEGAGAAKSYYASFLAGNGYRVVGSVGNSKADLVAPVNLYLPIGGRPMIVYRWGSRYVRDLREFLKELSRHSLEQYATVPNDF